MKFKIYFKVNDTWDYFIVEGESIEDICRIANAETNRRGLNEEDNELHSERLCVEESAWLEPSIK